jgi:hypothetical protein
MQPDIIALATEQAKIAAALAGAAPLDDLPWRIHRNTVWHGWIEAMGDTYPTVRALVGAPAFRGLAHSFLLAHPPRSASLKFIGRGFAAFLAHHPIAQEIPYLTDMAIFEAAWLDAFHAPDQDPLAPESLAHLAPEAVLNLVVTLHPSLRVFRSAFPIDAMFDAHQNGLADESDQPIALPNRGARLLIARPGISVEITPVSEQCVCMVEAMAQGSTVLDALEGAGGIEDMLPEFITILARRLVVDLSPKE